MICLQDARSLASHIKRPAVDGEGGGVMGVMYRPKYGADHLLSFPRQKLSLSSHQNSKVPPGLVSTHIIVYIASLDYNCAIQKFKIRSTCAAPPIRRKCTAYEELNGELYWSRTPLTPVRRELH
jgi:hypothetical protein